MDLAISLATQIGALFIMIGVGYVLIKTDICTISESKLLSQIVLYVSAPCAIINSFQIDLTEEKLKGFLLSIGAAILVHIIYLLRYSQRNVILMRLNQCPSCILTAET